MMNVEPEKIIEGEFLRRALKRSYYHEQEKERRIYTKDMLDVLEDMTDLPRDELERIAEEVELSYADDGESFFSLRYQLVFVGLSMMALFGIPVLAVWLL